MPFGEFMQRMAGYSAGLRIHRERDRHLDPLFCQSCCDRMERGMDRVRYLGKTILPGVKVGSREKAILAANTEVTVVYNEDGSLHHITVNETGGQIRPSDDGRGWQGFTPEEAAALY